MEVLGMENCDGSFNPLVILILFLAGVRVAQA